MVATAWTPQEQTCRALVVLRHLVGDRASLARRVEDEAVTDIEQQVARVWNPGVRPTVAEAWRCYGAGAHRAAVALTWAAVCTDLLDKIARLGEDGDAEAATWSDRVEKAGDAGLENAESVRAMQKAESEVLHEAVRFQLLDAVDARELKRLREDRHLCVHPSLRAFGDTYAPSAEYARAHLATALEALLTQPPTQGKKAVDRFISYVRDPGFHLSAAHVEQTFYEQVRPVTRRRIVDLAAKHAVLELEPSEAGLAADVVADRCAQCLEVLARRDRQLARDALVKVMDRTEGLDQAALGRAAARCGHLDVFWDVMPEAVRDLVRGLVDDLDVPIPAPPGSRYSNQSRDMDKAGARILALAGSPAAVAAVPQLRERFESATAAAKADVLKVRVLPAFASCAPSLLEHAWSFRGAEELTSTVVLPYAGALDLAILERTLDAWAGNRECWDASGMHDFSAELFRGTEHLRPRDREVWRSFLTRVRGNFDPDWEKDSLPKDWLPYEPLEEALTEAGYWP